MGLSYIDSYISCRAIEAHMCVKIAIAAGQHSLPHMCEHTYILSHGPMAVAMYMGRHFTFTSHVSSHAIPHVVALQIL